MLRRSGMLFLLLNVCWGVRKNKLRISWRRLPQKKKRDAVSPPFGLINQSPTTHTLLLSFSSDHTQDKVHSITFVFHLTRSINVSNPKKKKGICRKQITNSNIFNPAEKQTQQSLYVFVFGCIYLFIDFFFFFTGLLTDQVICFRRLSYPQKGNLYNTILTSIPTLVPWVYKGFLS